MSTTPVKGIMALLFVGVLMGALDLAIIGPALPAIQTEFGLNNRHLSWLFNVYVLAQLVGTPLLAKMSDRFGRRDIYIVSVFLFAAGSVLLVIAGNLETLLIGRTVQGFGASGIFPVAAAVIGDTFPEEQRGGALGLIGAVFGLAFLIGPVLGGILLQYAWQWLFVINIPIAGLLIGFAWKLLPATGSEQRKPFDWRGATLLTIALTSLAVSITNLDTTDLADSLASLDVWPWLLTAAILLPLFWRTELRAADPIIRPSFFRSRQLRLILIVAVGVGTVESAQVFFPALAVASLSVTESMGAWLMLPAVFVMMIVSPVTGKLVDRTGPTRIVQGSLIFVLLGMLIIGLAVMNYVSFLGGSMIGGVGLAALLGAPLRYIILQEASAEDRASAQGLLNLFLAFGQLAGAAVVGGVAASQGGGQIGYQSAYLVLAGLSLLVLLLSLGLKNKSGGAATAARTTPDPR